MIRPDRMVGSRSVRLSATVLICAAAICASLAYQRSGESGQGAVIAVTVVLSALAFFGLIYSSTRIFSIWMTFAHALQATVITVLFGACYLLIVPFFAPIARLLDPLRMRKRRYKTFWVERRRVSTDAENLSRMG